MQEEDQQREIDGKGNATKNSIAVLSFSLFTGVVDGVMKVGLPLAGAQLTTSPLAISALSVTLTLPFLLFSLHVGVLVDRFDRRLLLWLASAARLTAMGLLLVAVLTSSLNLPILYGAGAVLGIADVIALTSVSAVLPNAVPKERWEKINSWVAGIESICSQFLGPLLGGLIFAVGATFFFGFTTTGVALAALSLVLLVGRFRAAQVANAPAVSVNRQILEGVAYVWNQRLLRLMSLAIAVMCATWGAWFALMPLIATQELGLTSKEYGALYSALGVGGLLGAAAVGPLNKLMGRRWVMFLDLIGTIAIAATPLFTSNFWAVAAAAFAGGLGSTLWSVNGRTISQHLVSDGMRGRYSATARLLGWGPIPLGAAGAGILAELIGPRPALALFAIPVLFLIVPFMRAMNNVSLHDDTTGTPEPAGPGAEVGAGAAAGAER